MLLAFAAASAFAQDDELPPPSSNPKRDYDTTDRKNQKPPDPNDFQGFKKKKKVELSKFLIEPNFNFSIQQGRIDLGLSPYVGYNVWKGLCVGGGVTYFYTGFQNIGFQDQLGNVYYANAKWHTYGGGVFVQYNIWRGFFARTKFELLHRQLDDFYNGGVYIRTYPNNTYKVIIPKVQKTIPALLVGVGYNLLQSKNFFFPITVSYNLLHTVVDREYSLYPRGLVVQLGFINVF